MENLKSFSSSLTDGKNFSIKYSINNLEKIIISLLCPWFHLIGLSTNTCRVLMLNRD